MNSISLYKKKHNFLLENHRHHRKYILYLIATGETKQWKLYDSEINYDRKVNLNEFE